MNVTSYPFLRKANTLFTPPQLKQEPVTNLHPQTLFPRQSMASTLTLTCLPVYVTASSRYLSWKKKNKTKEQQKSKAVPPISVASLHHLAFHLRRQRCPWFGKYKSRGSSAGEHFTHRSFCYEPAALPSPNKVRDLSWTGYEKERVLCAGRTCFSTCLFLASYNGECAACVLSKA